MKSIQRITRIVCDVLKRNIYMRREFVTYTRNMTAPYKQDVYTYGYTLLHVDSSNLDALVQSGYEDIRLHHVSASRAFLSGAEALAYYCGKKLACFCFMAATPEAKKAVCPIPYYSDGDAIMGMGYTIPEFRSKGLMQALICEMFNFQYLYGATRFRNIIESNNYHSIHSAGNFISSHKDVPIAVGKGIYYKVLCLHMWKEVR